jgi:uncharacterized phage protein gp47/JayE
MLETPTTQQIADNITAQLEASLSQTVPLLPKAFTRVLAKAIAGVYVIQYKYAGFIFLQMFPALATMDETVVLGKTVRPLVLWGRLIGVGDPLSAVQAQHTIQVTVQSQVGDLPAGSTLVRAETGVIYQTVAAVPLDAPTVTVTIQAIGDQNGGDGSGDIGNLEVGDVVTFANPLANVATNATVLSQVVTGADGEKEDAYRARVLGRFQKKPQGGAYADYQEWGLEVAGIVNVYPYTRDRPGEIDVYVEADEASSGSADGIPTGAQLNAVLASIELDDGGLATRRPVNAAVNVLPITRTAFDVEIQGLVADDLAGTQAQLGQGIDEYLRSREPFIVGLSVLPRNDRITQAAIAGVVDTIVSAAGGTVTGVTLKHAGTVIPAYTLHAGEKAKLGTPNFV